jgi:hypothetical protein
LRTACRYAALRTQALHSIDVQRAHVSHCSCRLYVDTSSNRRSSMLSACGRELSLFHFRSLSNHRRSSPPHDERPRSRNLRQMGASTSEKLKDAIQLLTAGTTFIPNRIHINECFQLTLRESAKRHIPLSRFDFLLLDLSFSLVVVCSSFLLRTNATSRARKGKESRPPEVDGRR